tara:strand:- start:2578 stop:3474 length:897 start_codon:yes stop_codon:yes gene_type:complete
LEIKYNIKNINKNWGAVISPKDDKSLDFNYKAIFKHFRKYGVLNFRDFNLSESTLLEFSGFFTKRFANPDNRRQKRMESKFLLEADYWSDLNNRNSMGLHSESSFSSVWPEIVWFFCNTPAKKGGETTLCDGVQLWKILPARIKLYFLKQPIKYSIEIQLPKIKNIKRKGNQEWITNTLGVSGYVDLEEQKAYLEVLRYAMYKVENLDSYAFTNHLIADNHNEPQIKNISMASGEAIPNEYIKIIKEKSFEIIYEHNWKKNDLLMIDNKRFMHGRKGFAKNSHRDLLTIQTERSAFKV